MKGTTGLVGVESLSWFARICERVGRGAVLATISVEFLACFAFAVDICHKQ